MRSFNFFTFVAVLLCGSAFAGPPQTMAARDALPPAERAQYEQMQSALPVSQVQATSEQPVRIFARGHHFVTGDTVPAAVILYRFYTAQRCELPLADTKGMYAYWQPTAFGAGCWYPTLDDGYVVILANGATTKQPTYWEAFPRAALHSDGSATITEPNYDSDTFLATVAHRKTTDYVRQLKGNSP